MARKIQVKLILLLRSTRISQRAICKSRHMSRSSVSEVFRIAEEKHLTYADVESLPNSEVYSMFFPDKFPEQVRPGSVGIELDAQADLAHPLDKAPPRPAVLQVGVGGDKEGAVLPRHRLGKSHPAHRRGCPAAE